jgi:MGT family glycosyltransferase
MSKILFLNISAYGHVNPTLGLVNELVNQRNEVIYFSSEEFREKIEKSGAVFKTYGGESNPLKMQHNNGKETGINKLMNFVEKILSSSNEIIDDILYQTKDIKFDYIVYDSVIPIGNVIAKILDVPSISSFAVFITPKERMIGKNYSIEDLIKDHAIIHTYKRVSENLREIYNAELPGEISELFFNKGDINIAYTSRYFVSHIEYYDDSFKFIGPPIYDRKENLDFPFEKLQGKKVIYISLGTVFNSMNIKLYDIFFKTFADSDAVVVMTAYNIDISKFNIPENFIVKNYVPQSQILKYADVAVTHAGMNSISDLLYNNVPFVAIPIGGDQPFMAKRASELGAAISLDKDRITPEILKSSVKKVLKDPEYIENIKKISDSFKESGGYEKAVEVIFK